MGQGHRRGFYQKLPATISCIFLRAHRVSNFPWCYPDSIVHQLQQQVAIGMDIARLSRFGDRAYDEHQRPTKPKSPTHRSVMKGGPN